MMASVLMLRLIHLKERRSNVARPRESDLRSTSSVRTALLAGFAVVFGLWLLWGYQLVRSLQQIQTTVANAHDSYVRGEETLSRIRTNGGLLRLTVEDDGRGMTATSRVAAAGGLGLIGMRERAQSLGGTFLIPSRPGGGTAVAVTLPLDSSSVATDPQEPDSVQHAS